jgi:hypothetical protein
MERNYILSISVGFRIICKRARNLWGWPIRSFSPLKYESAGKGSVLNLRLDEEWFKNPY